MTTTNRAEAVADPTRRAVLNHLRRLEEWAANCHRAGMLGKAAELRLLADKLRREARL